MIHELTEHEGEAAYCRSVEGCGHGRRIECGGAGVHCGTVERRASGCGRQMGNSKTSRNGSELQKLRRNKVVSWEFCSLRSMWGGIWRIIDGVGAAEGPRMHNPRAS